MSCTCFSTASTFCANCSIVPVRFFGLISGCISSFGYSCLYIRPTFHMVRKFLNQWCKGKVRLYKLLYLLERF